MSVNQEPYLELRRRGWNVSVVLPNRWRHDYAKAAVAPKALDGMETALHPTPVALAGRAQRHLYLANVRSICRRLRPDVAFIEAEPFSLATFQWWLALRSLGVPFGVQCYENIDRALPTPIRWLRSRVLDDAAFVAARSETAASLARAWGASGQIGLAPPAVPGWNAPLAAAPRPFTIGYAGRLVENKGLADLLEAVRLLDAPVELLLIGSGEMRAQLEGQPIPGSVVRVLDGFSHENMPAAYAQIDVLALPSHTTPTWKEQFGRVIVEALWCGVPVVGSDSGEIPWVIGITKGGVVYPEGDHKALAARLRELRDAPDLRASLASSGRQAVERHFSIAAATDSLERLLLAAST